MHINLHKIVVRMSKFGIYLLVAVQSLGMVMAHETRGQRKMLSEIFIEVKAGDSARSLMGVFREIEEATDFNFAYSKSELKTRTVHLEQGTHNLFAILATISDQARVSFKRVNEQIGVTLIKDARPLPDPVEEVLTNVEVSGTVNDEFGQGLPGASVVEKGTNNGTTTDTNGKFRLVVAEGATIVVSFLGYKSMELQTGNQTSFDIMLEVDISSLEEVVVIGYGTVKKSDLTGSVSSIDTKDLENVPMASIDQGLIGRAAGVQVTQTSGMPGAIASIRVRGSSSLTGTGANEPLYVIDGFPVFNGTGFGNTGSDVGFSGLATLNPADIERIEILKDASATAIYGARASNGVVLITTKKGSRGNDKITFDAYFGVQNVANKIEMMNALEYAQLINEANTNDALPPVYDAAAIAELEANPKGTDWQDEVFRPGVMRNYQVTFSGGDQKMIYSISGNYFDQQGTIEGYDFKRYSGRINMERNVLTHVKIGTNLSLTRSIGNAKPFEVIRGSLVMNPVQPVYDENEPGGYTWVNAPGATRVRNPVAIAKEMVRETQVNRLLGSLFAEWEIVPGLKARTSIGVDLFDQKSNTYIPSFLFEAAGTASASISGGYTTNWLSQSTLTYTKRINDDHSITVLGGIEAQENHYEQMLAAASDFATDILEENDLEGGAVRDEPQSNIEDWSILSYFSRINYSLKDRYLLTFTSRVDGSSRFGANNKYGFFPSGAFMWKAIEEDFMQGIPAVSDLKVRTSYGITGFQGIDPYRSLLTLTSGTTIIGRQLVTTFAPARIPNPNLKWERTAQFDIGLDIGLFNNRVTLTADYYNKKTTDLLYELPVPLTTGYTRILQNIGSVRNHGVEFSISSDIVSAGDFTWTGSFNIAFNKNEVLDLGGDTFKDVGANSGFLGYIRRIEVGQPLGLFYGYVSDGLYRTPDEVSAGPTGGPYSGVLGGLRFKDFTNPQGTGPDGVVTPEDRKYIGNANPDFYGGMTHTLSYKGFNLSAFFQYSYGNDIFYDGSIEMTTVSGNHNVFKEVTDRWTPENTDAKYPVATTSLSGFFSDLYLYDGSYLKLKTLTLSYSFPGLKSKAIGGLNVYVTAQNLLTFTAYPGFDPEASSKGVTTLEAGHDSNTYPQSRVFMAGVRLDLK